MNVWIGRLALMLALAISTGAPARDIRVGIANAVSDVGIFVAQKKGYFAEEGLTVEVISFVSGANMVAPLGSGQLDVGGGSAAAAFYNAVARGIKMRIVADKASSLPGYAVNRLVIRKDLVDSGRFRSLADLRGMKLAMNAPGVSAQVTLDVALARAGMTRKDIETVNMSMPDYVAALANKAVDGSIATEPFASLSVRDKAAVSIIGDDELVPGHQIANLLYSEEFATTRKDEGLRFMKAYLRGVRFYNDALANGRIAGPNAREVIEILTASTPIKDPEIFRLITPSGCDPDGFVNIPSLKLDFDNYKAAGLIDGPVTVEEVVDTSFVEAAVKALGSRGKAGAAK